MEIASLQLAALRLGSNSDNHYGAQENDGGSDVYDCSEFKVVSNCCYTNCCCTNFGNFTGIDWNLPEFTLYYLNLTQFT